MHQFFGWIVISWHTSHSEKNGGRLEDPCFFHIDRLISLPFCLGSSWFLLFYLFGNGCCNMSSHVCYGVTIHCCCFFWGVGGRFTMVFLMGVTPPVIALGLPNTLASETVHLSRYDWKTTGMSIIHSNWVIIPR